MSQNKQEKIQKQKKVQGVYRKIKQQSRGDKDKNDNKIGVVIVNICVVLGILLLVLNAFIDDF
jgi:hypothetical protein